MKPFKDILRKKRKKKGLTQKQLSDTIGVSQNSYSRWETGETYPNFFNIIDLSKALGCTTDELLLGRDST